MKVEARPGFLFAVALLEGKTWPGSLKLKQLLLQLHFPEEYSQSSGSSSENISLHTSVDSPTLVKWADHTWVAAILFPLSVVALTRSRVNGLLGSISLRTHRYIGSSGSLRWLDELRKQTQEKMFNPGPLLLRPLVVQTDTISLMMPPSRAVSLEVGRVLWRL